MLVKLLVRVPSVAIFHAICFFLDGIFYPGLRNFEVKSPVFIVGHSRSGTTFVHRMMCEDSERFSFFLLYELWFPSLIQKKVIRALSRLDHRLGGKIEKRVRAWEQKKFAKGKDVHAMGLTIPEEDDFVLTSSCASGWWVVLLPYVKELDFHYVDQMPTKRRQRRLAHYRECVKRQLYLNGGNKIHLSKNPTFSGRVESLIEAFPDARFVVTVRHPYEIIPSNMKLMKLSWSLRGWEEARIKESLAGIIGKSFNMIRHPLEVLDKHPETKHAIINYPDLISQPKATIVALYKQLDLPISAEFEKKLDSEQAKAKAHKTSHSYSLAEFDLDGEMIHRELADLFERFHWEVASTPESSLS
jgi:hypothetical protein